MSLQRTLDLLHKRPILKDIERLPLPIPILGADDDEVLPASPFDAEGKMILDHLFDRVPEVASEVVDRHLFHI
jgi:hypothetical protein